MFMLTKRFVLVRFVVSLVLVSLFTVLPFRSSSSIASATHTHLFSIPTTGTVTQRFGTSHGAVDISSNVPGDYKRGNEVFAPYPGTVIADRDDFGKCAAGVVHVVEIDHGYIAARGKYVRTLYTHMGNQVTKQSYVQVKAGDRLLQGQLIGYQGDAARPACATGVHLHWGVYESNTPTSNGIPINPEIYTGPLSGYVTETSSQHYRCTGTRYGDANCDGVVNLSDLSIVASNWMKNSSRGDFNGDGFVNLSDLSILARNWMQRVPNAAMQERQSAASVEDQGTPVATLMLGSSQSAANPGQAVDIDVIVDGITSQGYFGADIFLQYDTSVLSYQELPADYISPACAALNPSSGYAYNRRMTALADAQRGTLVVSRASTDLSVADLPTGRTCLGTVRFLIRPDVATSTTTAVWFDTSGRWVVEGSDATLPHRFDPDQSQVYIKVGHSNKLVESPSQLREADYNGDGKDDILWRHRGSGYNSIWAMAGLSASDMALIPTVADLSWQMAGAGDFNGDGKSDVFWRNSVNGQNSVWLMNGMSPASMALTTPVSDLGWQVVGNGDYNGDGKSDLLWRHANGQNSIWLMNGTAIANAALITPVSDPNWRVVGSGDYNGDGKSDVLWRHSTSGQNSVWLMDSFNAASMALLPTVADTNWNIVGGGDYNGDGKSDVLWRYASGLISTWLMDGARPASIALVAHVADPGWQVAGSGDYNGDGKGDVLWRHNVSGQNSIWLMNGDAITNAAYTTPVLDLGWQVAGQAGTPSASSGLQGVQGAEAISATTRTQQVDIPGTGEAKLQGKAPGEGSAAPEGLAPGEGEKPADGKVPGQGEQAPAGPAPGQGTKPPAGTAPGQGEISRTPQQPGTAKRIFVPFVDR